MKYEAETVATGCGGNHSMRVDDAPDTDTGEDRSLPPARDGWFPFSPSSLVRAGPRAADPDRGLRACVSAHWLLSAIDTMPVCTQQAYRCIRPPVATGKKACALAAIPWNDYEKHYWCRSSRCAVTQSFSTTILTRARFSLMCRIFRVLSPRAAQNLRQSRTPRRQSAGAGRAGRSGELVRERCQAATRQWLSTHQGSGASPAAGRGYLYQDRRHGRGPRVSNWHRVLAPGSIGWRMPGAMDEQCDSAVLSTTP